MNQSSEILKFQLAFGVSPSIPWQGGNTCEEASTPLSPSPQERSLTSSRSSQRPQQTTAMWVASLQTRLSLLQRATAHLQNRFCPLDPDGQNLSGNPFCEIDPVFQRNYMYDEICKGVFIFCNTNVNPAFVCFLEACNPSNFDRKKSNFETWVFMLCLLTPSFDQNKGLYRAR